MTSTTVLPETEEVKLNVARLVADPSLTVCERAGAFAQFLERELDDGLLVAREVTGPMDREVTVRDAATGRERAMLMFGSNNYLGLANHPYVLAKVRETLDQFGAGLGGPPLLNGTMALHRRAEQRLSELKRMESALIYSSGYSANVGWIGALVGRKDVVVLDELNHASIFDGLRASKATILTFAHNSASDLDRTLTSAREKSPVNLFVIVEGVYSMDGDVAPLDRLVPVCKKHGAFIALDDAHGTGVLGAEGRGTAELFGVENEIDLVMGTFSKAFAASGAFVATTRDVVDYLRFFSRPYFFSASMPPVTLAILHAGLDVLEREPERRRRLHDNVRYLVRSLRAIGIETSSQSAIVPIHVGRNIRAISQRMHQAGIFVNAVEYPAVPKGRERFRVSVMSTHTREDIDRLVDGFERSVSLL